MSSRWVLFGYKVENDKYYTIPSEAQTVQRAFKLYTEGASLKKIADIFTSENIPYSKEKTVWNKNMISRIIENEHYKGDDKYPKIIEKKLFEEAVLKKNTLGGKREKDSEEIRALKSIIYCGSCSSRIRRVSSYARREKWLCENNCKVKRFFDDELLFGEIIRVINRAITYPDILDVQTGQDIYEPSIDVLRKTNELNFLLDQSNVQFSISKKVLFDCVESKFECCKFDASVYTEPLKEYLEQHEEMRELNTKVLSVAAEKIFINSDGSITVKFINGKEVNSRERTENGAETGSENSN